MVARTWLANDFFSCSDMNYYVRDKGATSLCVVTIGSGGFSSGGGNEGVQTIGRSAETGVFWPNEIIDTDGMHSTTFSPNIFVPTISGWYVMQGWYSWPLLNGGIRQSNCLFGPSLIPYGSDRKLFTGFADITMTITSAPMLCNGTTDFFQVTAYQDYSWSMPINNGALSVFRVRGA